MKPLLLVCLSAIVLAGSVQGQTIRDAVGAFDAESYQAFDEKDQPAVFAQMEYSILRQWFAQAVVAFTDPKTPEDLKLACDELEGLQRKSAIRCAVAKKFSEDGKLPEATQRLAGQLCKFNERLASLHVGSGFDQGALREQLQSLYLDLRNEDPKFFMELEQ